MGWWEIPNIYMGTFKIDGNQTNIPYEYIHGNQTTNQTMLDV